jgi:hypothetical protein
MSPVIEGKESGTSISGDARRGRRRIERGIYEQPNGKYMVCFMVGDAKTQ